MIKLKKIIAIILTAVMCLLFAACSSNEGNADEIPECDFSALYDEYQDNKEVAKENYVGNTYRFAGTVREIESNYISLAPIKFPAKPYGGWFLVKIYMSKEDIKKVSVLDVVNVSGKISLLQDRTNPLIMKNGVLIDDVIDIEGEINSFLLNSWVHSAEIKDFSSSGEIIFYCPTGSIDKYETEKCEIKGIEFTKGDHIKGKAKLKSTGYTDSFDIVELVSIEKS